MNNGIPKRFEDFIHWAVGSALGRRVKAVTPDDEAPPWVEDETLVAVMGLYSDQVTGSFLLAAEADLLRRLHPMQGARPIDEKLMKDWIGEIANLAVGQLKKGLMPYGVEIRVRPPSVEAGADQLLARYADDRPTLRMWLEVEGFGLVCAQLSAEIDAGVAFDGLPLASGG